ncbi:hypothetical protein Dimus_018948, partial [Dionaea muscipula]
GPHAARLPKPEQAAAMQRATAMLREAAILRAARQQSSIAVQRATCLLHSSEQHQCGGQQEFSSARGPRLGLACAQRAEPRSQGCWCNQPLT